VTELAGPWLFLSCMVSDLIQGCVGVVDGNWSPWMTWGECPTTTCTGVRQRTRECVNPPPSNGGAECYGNSEDTGPCDPIVSTECHLSFW